MVGEWGERIAGSLFSVRRGQPASIYGLLNNDRRRFALFYLLKHRGDGPQSLGDIAEQVAAWEGNVSVEEVSPEARKLAYNSLQQFHLPELAESGMVRYDSDRGVAEITSRGKALGTILIRDLGREHPWWAYYATIALFAGVIALSYHLQIAPISMIEPVSWMLVLWGILLTVSLLHVLSVPLKVRFARKPPSLDEPDDA